MSKKRFTEGLESLFADTTEEPVDQKQSPTASRKEKAGKSPSGKDFSSDLHAFLQSAFEESFEEQVSQPKQERLEEPAPKPRRRPSSGGLDALIRNTLEPSTMHIDPNATRRLVVAFKEEQLDKLKVIARQEKTYLKKIINEIVEEYIQQYDQEQGEERN